MLCIFFFFQAEDGIRDGHVTGVQTCALPISPSGSDPAMEPAFRRIDHGVARAVAVVIREATVPGDSSCMAFVRCTGWLAIRGVSCSSRLGWLIMARRRATYMSTTSSDPAHVTVFD